MNEIKLEKEDCIELFKFSGKLYAVVTCAYFLAYVIIF